MADSTSAQLNCDGLPIPDFYVVYHGSAWFAIDGTLIAAPIKVDGAVDWDMSVDVECIEPDEYSHVKRICKLFDVADITQRFQ